MADSLSDFLGQNIDPSPDQPGTTAPAAAPAAAPTAQPPPAQSLSDFLGKGAFSQEDQPDIPAPDTGHLAPRPGQDIIPATNQRMHLKGSHLGEIPEHYNTTLGDTAQELINDASFGTGKYLEAAGSAGFRKLLHPDQSFGDLYGKDLGDIRQSIHNFGAANPTGQEILGVGVPVGEGLMTAGMSEVPEVIGAAGSLIREAPSIGRTILNGAKTLAKNAGLGAGAGAISGAANQEGNDWQTYVYGAGEGAKMGAILGAAIPIGVRGATGLVSALKGVIGKGDQEWATNAVLHAMFADGISPRQAMARFHAWQADGAKPEALLDLGGDALRRLARVIYTQGGEPASALEHTLTARAVDRVDRIMGDVAEPMDNPERNVVLEGQQLPAQHQQQLAAATDLAHQSFTDVRGPQSGSGRSVAQESGDVIRQGLQHNHDSLAATRANAAAGNYGGVRASDTQVNVDPVIAAIAERKALYGNTPVGHLMDTALGWLKSDNGTVQTQLPQLSSTLRSLRSQQAALARTDREGSYQLGQVGDALESQINEVDASLQHANAAYREASVPLAPYRDPEVGHAANLLQRDDYNLGYSTESELVPRRYFNSGSTSASDMQEFNRLLGNSPDAVEGMRRYIANDAMRSSLGADGTTFNPQSFRKWLNAHQDALRQFPQVHQDLMDWAGAVDTAHNAATSSTPMRLMQAIEQGRGFDGMDPEAIRATMLRMSPQERELFQQGAMRALRDKMGTRSGPGAVTGQFNGRPGNFNLRNRIAAVFGNEASFNRFAARAAREANMMKNENFIPLGTQTANKAGDVEKGVTEGLGKAFGEAVAYQSYMPVAKWAAGKAWARIKNRGKGYTQGRTAEINRIIGDTDPEQVMNRLQELDEAHQGPAGMGRPRQRISKAAGVAAGVAGGLGNVGGHMPLPAIPTPWDEVSSPPDEAAPDDGADTGLASGGRTRTGLERAFHELHEDPPAILAHTAKKFGAADANKQRIAIAFSKARQGFAGGGLAGQTLVGPDDTPPDDIGVPPQFRPQAENDHAQQIYDDNFSSPTLSGLLSPEPGWDYSSQLPVAHRDVYQGGPLHQSDREYKAAWPGSWSSLAQGVAGLVMGGDRQPMSDNPDAMSIASGGLMSNQMEEPMLAWGLRGIGRKSDPNTLGMFAGQKAKVGPASPKDWFTGVDGARKFEVSDYGSNINPEVMDAAREKLIQNRLAAVPRRDRGQDDARSAGKYVDDHVGTDVQLGDFLNHDRLYAQYPELPNIRVSSMTMPRGYKGAFIPPGTEQGGRYGRLLVNAQALRDDPQDVHSTVLHELQHYIQEKEGFAPGANLQAAAGSLNSIWSARSAAARDPSLTPEARAQAAEDAERVKKFLGYDKQSIYTAYHNTAGEVEARNVQARFKKQQSMVGDPQADLFSETPAQVAKRFGYAKQFEQGQPLSKVGVSPSRTADVAAKRQFVWEPGEPNAGLKLSLDDGLAAGEPKAAARNIKSEGITTQSLRGLPMDQATQLAQSGVHLRQNPTTGQYVGGPRGVDSGAKLGAIRRGFDQALALGVPGRNWYEASQGTIHDITGSDPQRMGLAANEFAHWSPQATPETNLGFSLKAHNAYEAGAPADIVRTGAQVRAYNEARDAGGLPKLGQKTGIFGEHLDPNAEDPSTGTNDIWHARAFGFTNHDGGPFDRALTAQEHAFLDGETVLATQRANAKGIGGHTDWTPGKVQAAAWVGRKAMSLMEKGMSQEDAMAKSMPDFSTYLNKHTANATHEAAPGAGTGHLQSLLSATPEERAAYSADPRSSWATAPGGRDAIYDAMGMYARPTQQATGFFTPHGLPPESNPASVARPLVDYAQDARGHAQMSPVSEGMLNAGEATRAYIDAQNMGAWHKLLPEGPAYAGPASEQSSAHIPLKRQLSRDEMLQLGHIMEPRNLTPVDTGHGVSLLRNGDGPSAKDMQKLLLRGDLGKQIANVLPDAGPATRARLLSNSIDYQKNFAAKNEGKGLATRQLFSQLDNKAIPAVMGKLDASPAIREAAGARLARDAEYSSKTGDPVRKDIQNARRILQEGGLTGLRAALARKEYLPAIAAGGLGLGALSLQDQQNQD